MNYQQQKAQKTAVNSITAASYLDIRAQTICLGQFHAEVNFTMKTFSPHGCQYLVV